MTNEEKANEIKANDVCCVWNGGCPNVYNAAMEMAEWKDKQMMELWNVARNVYEAWMGGTMNDVRECMQDLGHVYNEFKDKGMY